MTQVKPQLAATLVPVASLTLHPRNVRRHDERFGGGGAKAERVGHVDQAGKAQPVGSE